MSTESTAFSPESWEYARGYAGVFGATPSSFTSVIRSLVNEHGAGLAQSTGSSKYFAVRLLRSPSLIAPLYFFCLHARPGVVVPNGVTSAESIVQSFGPLELAYVLGLIYVTRRAKLLCDAEEWKFFEEPLAHALNAAVTVGDAIPAIGSATAIMEASAPFLGVSAFLKHDPKGFKEYRRTQKRSTGEWSVEEEVKRWGCNHLQIASVMMQTLGFGIMRANALLMALSGCHELGSSDEVNLARDFRMAQLWRTALVRTGTGPTVPLPPKYYPNASAQACAIEKMKKLKLLPASDSWIFKGKDDLPACQVPAVASADDASAEPVLGEPQTAETPESATIDANRGGEPV